MKTKILMALLVSLFVILVVSPGIPAGNKAAERGQDAGKGPKAPPEIEVVTFVNTPYWNSPPWYPPEDETDTYRLVRGGVQWASNALPVDCVVYTSGASGAPTGALAAVTPAFGVWDGQTSTSIYDTISDDGGTPPGMIMDGSNTVCWGTIDGPGGTIAVTQFVFWSNTKELVEFDIKFDSEELWSTTGAEDAFDVQNVMTHELGHTLVLDDLRSPRDGALTMHAYTWPGDSTKRDLGSGDILGIRAIYGD